MSDQPSGWGWKEPAQPGVPPAVVIEALDSLERQLTAAHKAAVLRDRILLALVAGAVAGAAVWGLWGR